MFKELVPLVVLGMFYIVTTSGCDVRETRHVSAEATRPSWSGPQTSKPGEELEKALAELPNRKLLIGGRDIWLTSEESRELALLFRETLKGPDLIPVESPRATPGPGPHYGFAFYKSDQDGSAEPEYVIDV